MVAITQCQISTLIKNVYIILQTAELVRLIIVLNSDVTSIQYSLT